MLNILTITAPIYLLILAGYCMTRWGIFTSQDLNALGKFVVQLALPALLFKAISERPLNEILNASYLLAYAVGSLTAAAIGAWWARHIARQPPLASVFYAFGTSCSNSGFIGFPIVLLTLPSVAGVALALNMVVENLIVLPLLLIWAERARGAARTWHEYRALLGRLALNPIILAMLAGLCVSIFSWSLPSLVKHTVDLVALASSALSLFVIGGMLVGLHLGRMGVQVSPISVGKLVLHPLCVFLATLAVPWLGLPPLSPALQSAAVLFAAMPMMGIYTTLAQQYGQQHFSAVAQLLTTVASFFTLSGLLWLMQASH